MSLILDALKRSESEENRAPPISMVGDPSIQSESTSNRLVASVAVVVVAFFIFLGFWWFELGSSEDRDHPTAAMAPGEAQKGEGTMASVSQETPSQRARAQAPDPPNPVIAEPASPSLSAGDQSRRRGADSDASELAALNRAMWADAGVVGSEEADRIGAPLTDQIAAAGRVEQVALVERMPKSVDEGQVDAPEIDLQEVMERLALEAGDAALSPHPVPLLENLTQQQKDRVPTIIYSAHQFGGDDNPSFVELNGSRLREGESDQTIRVVEILDDSVILSAVDTQFRLKALNSWINL